MKIKLKRLFCMVLTAIVVLSLAACSSANSSTESGKSTGDVKVDEGTDLSTDDDAYYEHDPRENPEAMKDIVENADAVYGFSPAPDSTRLGAYAEYDWTDPEFVARAQEERRAYHESLSTMMDILYKMRDEGATMEEMARGNL